MLINSSSKHLLNGYSIPSTGSKEMSKHKSQAERVLCLLRKPKTHDTSLPSQGQFKVISGISLDLIVCLHPGLSQIFVYLAWDLLLCDPNSSCGTVTLVFRYDLSILLLDSSSTFGLHMASDSSYSRLPSIGFYSSKNNIFYSPSSLVKWENSNSHIFTPISQEIRS